MRSFDFLVIGAGIAGASVAAELVEHGSVLILEAEPHAGQHATGRSAALFSEAYGGEVVRALSRASRVFFFDPPSGFSDAPLVRPRGTLFIARTDQLSNLAALAGAPGMATATRPVDPAEASRLCPLLANGYTAAAIFEPGSADVEVNGLHQGFLRRVRGAGGILRTNLAVREIEQTHRGWSIGTAEGPVTARHVINAAGAWADEVAALAGVPPIGLQPRRRTAILVAAPKEMTIDEWPLVIDADEAFYFKPDAGRILLSPADETPSPPCDAQADELDIAVAIDRVERATSLRVGRVVHRWAGLRSFVADRSPVASHEPTAPGFFWLAGQGGYGIQTAPALARAAAALILGRPLPDDITALGVTRSALSRERLDLQPRV